MKLYQLIPNQKGVSALEFTILAPLLFVLVYGLVEFSIIFYDKAMITNASRVGARAGIIPFVDDLDTEKPTISGIQNRAVEAAKTYLYKNTTFTNLKLIYFGAKNAPVITPTLGDAPASGGNRLLKVVVSWNYKFLVLPNFKNLGFVNFDPTITLNSVTEMMLLENPAP